MKEKLEEKAEQGETENRKSVWKKLLIGFFITLCVLIVLPFVAFIGPIYAVAYAVCTPFEKKKYRKSFYWRELKVKYYWGITSGFDYLFYNAARCIRTLPELGWRAKTALTRTLCRCERPWSRARRM